MASRDLERLRELVKRSQRRLEELGVVALLVFGSALGRTWRGSDLDVAVLLRPGAGKARLRDLYSMIQREVRSDVDLLTLNLAPPRLRMAALRGELLYVGDRRAYLRFVQRTLDEWADLEPLRRTVGEYTRRWLELGG